MNGKYLVNKSNNLITASYDLTLQEQKLILTLASMVQPKDTDFKEYEFKIKDFMDLLGLEDKSKYTQIPKITKELMKKVFEIREGEDILQLSWLSSARYNEGSGIVILKFDSSLKPYLLQLSEFYTKYRLENILQLKSKYSLRIYELLKSNQYLGTYEISLEDLKEMLGATEKSYSVYQNVKNRIILRAQKELKEKTDISFTFTEIKFKRKVSAIKFYINKNKIENESKIIEPETPKLKTNEINEKLKIVLDICEDKVELSEAVAIIKAVNGDIESIRKAYLYCKDKDINNLTGYMIKILKSIKDGTFNEVTFFDKEKKNPKGFNNFEGRSYSERYYQLLEKVMTNSATELEIEEFDNMKRRYI